MVAHVGAQIWHWCHFLAESDQFTREKKLELARYCWSAFPDAFWHALITMPFVERIQRWRSSPRACLGAIAAVLVLVTLVSGIIPAARSYVSSAIPQPDRVCLINLNGKYWHIRSETLLNLSAAWKESKLLDSVASYSWGATQFSGPERSVSVVSAEVEPGFFQVLRLNAALGRTFRKGDDQNCNDCVVLSHDIWEEQFDGDPQRAGPACDSRRAPPDSDWSTAWQFPFTFAGDWGVEFAGLGLA